MLTMKKFLKHQWLVPRESFCDLTYARDISFLPACEMGSNLIPGVFGAFKIVSCCVAVWPNEKMRALVIRQRCQFRLGKISKRAKRRIAVLFVAKSTSRRPIPHLDSSRCQELLCVAG